MAYGLHVEDTHPTTGRHGEIVGAYTTREEAEQEMEIDPDRDHLTVAEVTA